MDALFGYALRTRPLTSCFSRQELSLSRRLSNLLEQHSMELAWSKARITISYSGSTTNCNTKFVPKSPGWSVARSQILYQLPEKS